MATKLNDDTSNLWSDTARYIWEYDYVCKVKREQQEAVKNDPWVTGEEGEETMEDNQLYQIKGTETYGYVLATNSKGQKVFEVKGSGEVKTVAPDQLEEVIPYSVGIKFNSSDSTYHYWVDEGSVKEGDLLYQNKSIFTNGDRLCQVVKVNTKSKRANKRFEGVIVQTKPLK